VELVECSPAPVQTLRLVMADFVEAVFEAMESSHCPSRVKI